jgi:hypothetical protein
MNRTLISQTNGRVKLEVFERTSQSLMYLFISFRFYLVINRLGGTG